VCLCECGNWKSVAACELKSEKTKSCGCYDAHRKKTQTIKHGYNRTPTYTCWRNMLARCGNPNDARYGSYGGRGITVCDRWREFKNFLADMGEKPGGLTIERKDVNGNYEPGNSVWATQSEQDNNKRQTIFVVVNGERMSAKQAAARLGALYERVRWAISRYGDGWSDYLVRAAAAIASREAGKGE